MISLGFSAYSLKLLFFLLLESEVEMHQISELHEICAFRFCLELNIHNSLKILLGKMWEGAHMMIHDQPSHLRLWDPNIPGKVIFRVPQSLYSPTRALRVAASLHLFSHAFFCR